MRATIKLGWLIVRGEDNYVNLFSSSDVCEQILICSHGYVETTNTYVHINQKESSE